MLGNHHIKYIHKAQLQSKIKESDEEIMPQSGLEPKPLAYMYTCIFKIRTSTISKKKSAITYRHSFAVEMLYFIAIFPSSYTNWYLKIHKANIQKLQKHSHLLAE